MGGCVSIITFSYVLVSQIGRILDFKRIPHPRYAYDVSILFRSGSRTEPCFQYKGSGHNRIFTVERQDHRSSYFLEAQLVTTQYLPHRGVGWLLHQLICNFSYSFIE